MCLFDRKKEETTVVIGVEGMMCPHCEARVKKALENVKGVKEATADHVEGKVTVRADADIDRSKLEKAITDQGYKVKND